METHDDDTDMVKLFAEDRAHLPEDGFTARVMDALPRRKNRVSARPWVLGICTLLAAAVACFVPPVQNALVQSVGALMSAPSTLVFPWVGAAVLLVMLLVTAFSFVEET